MESDTLAISSPGPGTSKSLIVPEGQQAVLDFEVSDISDIDLTSAGSLEIKLINGGTIVIGNFRALADADVRMELSDGTPLETGSLYETLTSAEGSAPVNEPVDLIVPPENTTSEFTVEAGQKYVMNFDMLAPEEVSIDNSDLLIRFNNGGLIILKDFEEVESGELPPELTLADGSVISGEDLITTIRLAKATPDDELFQEIGEPKVHLANTPVDLTEETPLERAVEQQITEELNAGDFQSAEELNELAQQMAQTEPAGGEQMADLAQQLAQVEPAAGPTAATPAAGRGGFGFQSDVTPVAIGPIDAIGPLGPTALQYVAPQFADEVFPDEEVESLAEDGAPEIVSSLAILDESGLATGTLTETDTINFDYGADGPGSVGPNGAFDSFGSLAGGTLTHQGVPVTVNATLDGYEGFAGNIKVFDIVIDSLTGEYTFRLFEQLDHADGSDPNDLINLEFGIVISDADGDTAETTVVVGIQDDAPVVTAPAPETIDEDALSGGPVTLTGKVASDIGEDVTGSLEADGNYQVSGDIPATGLTSGGEDVIISQTATGYEGVTTTGTKVFDLVFTSADGDYDFTLYEQLDHAAAGNRITFNFGVVATDYDADTASTEIVIHVEDDVPVIGAPEIGKGLENIDETNLEPVTVSGTLDSDFGADGPGNIEADGSFSANGEILTGTLQHNGVDINVASMPFGYVGMAGNVKVFELIITDPLTGDYEFTLFENLDHSDPNAANEVIELNFGVVISDADGDLSSGNILMNVADDVPVIASVSSNIDEADIGGPAEVTGTLVHDYGEDGPGDIQPADNYTSDQPLTSGGEAVTVTTTATGYVGTAAGGDAVFEIVFENDGDYTFTLLKPLDHAAGTDELTINFDVGIVDYDGDTDLASVAIKVNDDGPHIGEPDIGSGLEKVDETSYDTQAALQASGTLDVDFGEDGPGEVSVNGNSSSSTPLFSNGAAVIISETATGYVGQTAAGTTVFDLTVEDDGDYTYTQHETLDHPDTTDHDDTISLRFGVGVTDSDGDTADGSIVIKVDDDGPVARDDYNEFDTNAGGTDGNVVTGLNADNANAADDASNDMPNNVTEISFGNTTLDVPETGTVSIDGDYGTLTIAADGSYTYVLFPQYQGNLLAEHEFVNTEDFPSLAERRAVGGGQMDSMGVADGDLEVTSAAKVNVTFVSEGAGYSNTLGAYAVGADGSLQSVSFLIENGNNVSAGDNFSFDIPGGGVDQSYGFFLIANGYSVNGGYSGLDLANGELEFVYKHDTGEERTAKITDDGGDISLVYTSAGGAETVLQGPVFHTTERGGDNDINFDDSMRVVSGLPDTNDDTVLRIGFEDLPVNNSDIDYNDLIFDVSVTTISDEVSDQFVYTYTDDDGDSSTAILELNGKDLVDDIPVVGSDQNTIDETNLGPITITDDISVDYGADAPGNLKLTAYDVTGSVAGGVLSHQGEEVVVTATAGDYVGTAQIGGSAIKVFEMALTDNDGGYEFKLYEQLDHADSSDPNDVITLSFETTATDADGDTSTGTIEVNIADDAVVANDDYNEFNTADGGADGNVITGLNADNTGAADMLSEDVSNTVTEVSFGATTVAVPATGSATINGDHGVLEMFADGTYNYTLTGNASAQSASFFPDSGDVAGTSNSISKNGITITGNGIDLTWVSQEGAGVGVDSAGYDSAKVWPSGEKLTVDFDPATAVTFTIADIGSNNVDDAIDFQIKLESGAVVDYSFDIGSTNPVNGRIEVNLNAADFGNNDPITEVAISAVSDPASFLLHGVEVQYPAVDARDSFTYTLQDHDGDTDTAVLELKANEPPVDVDVCVNNGADNACVKEDGSVDVPLYAAYTGGDGDEVMTLTLSGVDTSWDVTAQGWSYIGGGQYELVLAAGEKIFNQDITFAPPADSDLDLQGLDLTASVYNPDGAQTITATDGFGIVVDAVVDQPELEASDVATQYWYYKNKAYNVSLDVDSSVTDTDGSEVITKMVFDLNQPFNDGKDPFFTLDDMDIGLNKGTEVSPGIWEIAINNGDAASVLNDLALVVPPDQNYSVIHQNETGGHTANIIVRSYVEEANLGGSEYDYTDNATVVTKCLSITFRITPLVLDLDGDGISIIDISETVLFDMNNNGTLDRTSWVEGDDGLLAMDFDGDGIITNQSELFGGGDTVNDGFAKLALYDTNADGVIDVQDDVFTDLLVWQDVNQDGISQSGEMHSLDTLSISSISLTGEEAGYVTGDSFVSHESTFTYENGETSTIADVWFNVQEGSNIGQGATIAGTEQNEVIYGTEGSDVLAGLAGDDVLYGGEGADLFLFEQDGGFDTIADFNIEEGDQLDLSALLQNNDSVTDAINDFVYARESEGNTIVSVDTDGAGGNAAVDVASLQGVTGVEAEDLVYNEALVA